MNLVLEWIMNTSLDTTLQEAALKWPRREIWNKFEKQREHRVFFLLLYYTLDLVSSRVSSVVSRNVHLVPDDTVLSSNSHSLTRSRAVTLELKNEKAKEHACQAWFLMPEFSAVSRRLQMEEQARRKINARRWVAEDEHSWCNSIVTEWKEPSFNENSNEFSRKNSSLPRKFYTTSCIYGQKRGFAI